MYILIVVIFISSIIIINIIIPARFSQTYVICPPGVPKASVGDSKQQFPA